MIIGIIGLIGSGKSSVAKMIAESENMLFFDMDAEFPDEYKERHRKGEVVPALDVKEYQRVMLERIFTTKDSRHVVMAGFFLDKELPQYIESRENVLWINLVTQERGILEERIRNRQNHFAAGLAVLDDNWPIRHEQLIGDIKIDCNQPIEQVLQDCLLHIRSCLETRQTHS